MKQEKLKEMLSLLRKKQESADEIGEHAPALIFQSAINEVNNVLEDEIAQKSD